MNDTAQSQAKDATRFMVVEFGGGQTVHETYRVIDVFNNEPAARKRAEDAAIDSEDNTKYGVFQKIGEAHAERKAVWKGVA